MTATVVAGTGYEVDSAAASASVDVYDDDEAPAPSSSETLWSSTLEWTAYGGGWLIANAEDFTGSSWSEDGAWFHVRYFAYNPSSGELWLTLTSDMPAGGILDPGALTLQVGEATMEPGDVMTAFAAGDIGIARNVRQDWAAGDRVEVRLTRTHAEEAVASGPGISVEDAQVHEAEGAVLSFRVTLDAAQTTAVSVRHATSDGTAVAGADYVATSGTLRFAPGETSKTVSVPVLNDTHDERSETLTLTLSNPFGGQIPDRTATGTITNTDHMSQAWLARFGRTVADQVLDAVDARIATPRTPGTALTFAGQRVGAGAVSPEALGAREAEARVEALSEWLRNTDGEVADERTPAPRELTGRDLLTGSSFAFSGGTPEGGTGALWGRGAVSRFDGREGELSRARSPSTPTLRPSAVRRSR